MIVMCLVLSYLHTTHGLLASQWLNRMTYVENKVTKAVAEISVPTVRSRSHRIFVIKWQ